MNREEHVPIDERLARLAIMVEAIDARTRDSAADLKSVAEKVTILEGDFSRVSSEFRGTTSGRGSMIERLLTAELNIQAQADRLERFASLTRKIWLALGMTAVGAAAQAILTARLLR